MAAGYKDFTAGSALPAGDLEDYCERQAVMQFASEAARDSALTGVKTNGTMAYTTDASTLWRYDGTGWIRVNEPTQTYTPTWTQTAAVTKTVNFARYSRSNGWCKGYFKLTATGAGTGGGTITGGLPVAAYTTAGALIGPAILYDSGTEYSVGNAITASSTTFVYTTQSATTLYRTTPTIASGDVFYVSFEYEMSTPYL